MAEVFAIVAGVIGCAQGAKELGKLARNLRRVGKGIQGAEVDIPIFANSVRSFSDTIGIACMSLEEYLQDEDAQESPIIQHLRKKRIFSQAVEQFNLLYNELNENIPKITVMKGLFELLVMIKWALGKKERDLMLAKMESVKTTFLIIQQSVILTTLRAGFRNEKVEKEIKRLKRTIETLLDINESMQIKIEQQEANILSMKPDHGRSVFVIQDLYEALHHLGDTLTKRGRVPGYPRASPTTTPTQSPMQSNISTRTINFQPSSSSEQDIIPDTPARRSHNMAGVTSAGTNKLHGVPSQKAVTTEEGVMCLDPKDEYAVEPGLIIGSQGGEIDAQIKYNNNIDDSIMSERFAVEHNIDISYFENTPEVHVGPRLRVGMGSIEPCIGEVTLSWQIYTTRPDVRFKVHFWVYRNTFPGLLLGKDFTESKVQFESQRGLSP